MPTKEYRKILLNEQSIQVTVEGDELVTEDGKIVGIEEAQHLPPTQPSKIICVHLNYESRVKEYITKLPPAPTYFHKPITALNSHQGNVVRPERCKWLNYEGEIAIVIGQKLNINLMRKKQVLQKWLLMRVNACNVIVVVLRVKAVTLDCLGKTMNT